MGVCLPQLEKQFGISGNALNKFLAKFRVKIDNTPSQHESETWHEE